MSARPGRFLPTDEDGFIVNDCSLARLPPGWRGGVDACVERARGALGEALHSVWLRGSAVSGHAVLGVSDLDLIVIADRPAPDGELWLPMRWSEVGLAPPGCVDVELPLASLAALGMERGAFLRFLLATQAVAVVGDLDLPRYRVGPDIAFVAPQLGEALRTASSALEEPLSESDRRDWTRWLAKTVVRAGLDLVLEEEGRYARDLWPCYLAFSRVYPERAPAMLAAVDAAVAPAEHPGALEDLIDSLGPWVWKAWQACTRDR